jgi:hypothetical protein
MCGGRFRAISALTRSGLSAAIFGSPIRLPIALIEQTVDSRASSPASTLLRETFGKLGETARFMRRPEQTSRRALTAQGDLEGMNNQKLANRSGHKRSDTPHLRPLRKLTGKSLSPHGCSGRRRAASRNQRNWFAATAGAMTWLRVLSSGGIADAASVSVNAMDQRHGRGRRRSRNSLVQDVGRRAGSKGLGPFSFRATSGDYAD